MTSENKAELEGDQPAAAARCALPDRKELAATAFERTRMPMVITDARQNDYPIVLANAAFLELTGYAAEEVIGRNCRFLQGEGTSQAALAEIRAGLKQDRNVTVELLNYRKDGSAFWNQLYCSPVHDEAGNLIYHFASQIDRTQFRRVQALEASEHRLLLEVDHRAKNVLALVDSIVRLSRADDPERYAAAIQHRVQALSKAHVLLSEHSWRDISLEQVIATQLNAVSRHQVTTNGPPVLIDPVAVQPLSLVFHELAINAVEHGALSARTGVVTIEWMPMTAPGSFELNWMETGGPPTRPPQDKGFGLVISDAVVRRQMMGDVARQWTQSGLVTTIRVPRQFGI